MRFLDSLRHLQLINFIAVLSFIQARCWHNTMHSESDKLVMEAVVQILQTFSYPGMSL